MILVDKNFYIKLIEHALSFQEPFEKEEYLKNLPLKSYEKTILNAMFSYSYDRKRQGGTNTLSTIFEDINGGKYTLNYEATFNYLEYQELKESRESAENARKYSIVAISFAILSIILTGIIGFLQLNKPIEIADKQFQQLINK